MRNRTFIFLCLSVICLIAACKQEDSATEDTTTQTDTTTQQTDMPWTFLTDGIYHNNVTVTVGQDLTTNPNEGHWIDFHSNGKFDYGIWGETSYSGTWFYDNQSALLELTPSGDQKRSEWRVMHRDRTLILQGTPKFQDNALQMRFIKHDSLPSK